MPGLWRTPGEYLMTGADLDRWILAMPDEDLAAIEPSIAAVAALQRKEFLLHGGLHGRVMPPDYGQVVTPRQPRWQTPPRF